MFLNISLLNFKCKCVNVSFLCFNVGEIFSVLTFSISTGNNWKGPCTSLSVGCFDKSPNTKTPYPSTSWWTTHLIYFAHKLLLPKVSIDLTFLFDQNKDLIKEDIH